MPRQVPHDEAVSPTIGTLLLLAITFVLAVAVLAVALQIKGADRLPRAFGFVADYGNRTIEVVSAPTGVPWTGIQVTGCSGVPTGFLDPGDLITGCHGPAHISDLETNSALVHYVFPE